MTSETNDTPFGLDLTDAQYDALMFKHVRQDMRQYEGALYTSKWFDYRFMNPVASAYLYADEYVKQFRIFYRKTIDYRATEGPRPITPMKNKDLFKCPQPFITAIWRGRQHADAMGIPYDLYLEFAFEGRLRFWKRAHLPGPALLYSTDVCEYVQEQWEKRQLGVLFYGRHSAYRVHRYAGTPAQNDHHEWLLDQATKRTNAFMSLNDMFEGELLPIEKIRLRFGEDVSQRILEAA